MTAPIAYIVHKSHDRIRFRLKEKRKDADYFHTLRTQLSAIPDIDVRINEALGSVVIIHPGVPYADLAAQMEQMQLFDVAESSEPKVHALSPLFSSIRRLDRLILSGTSGTVDLRTLMFIGAVLLAIRQIRRGELFSPALPLLWSAIELASRFGNNSDTSDPEQ